MPTQEEFDAHSATHLPHVEWCELCVAGRGRNKPHKWKKEAPEEANEREPGCQEDASEAVGTAAGPAAEDAPPSGRVPRVCMDYFYVSSRHGGPRKGAQSMSTKELKRKLTEVGRSAEGARNARQGPRSRT